MKTGKEVSLPQSASINGGGCLTVIDALRRMGEPVTRASYLRADFRGNVPKELDAEYVASMPKELQRP